jgi:hypothetical protein
MPVAPAVPLPDQLAVTFDDTHVVAGAGLLLAATLSDRLGLAGAADRVIDLGDRAGAAHPGAKLLTLVHAMVAGGDCIDDVDVLRCGATSSVLGHRVMAPRRSARSCARSRSGTPVSSTSSPSTPWSARGPRAPGRVTGRW